MKWATTCRTCSVSCPRGRAGPPQSKPSFRRTASQASGGIGAIARVCWSRGMRRTAFAPRRPWETIPCSGWPPVTCSRNPGPTGPPQNASRRSAAVFSRAIPRRAAPRDRASSARARLELVRALAHAGRHPEIPDACIGSRLATVLLLHALGEGGRERRVIDTLERNRITLSLDSQHCPAVLHRVHVPGLAGGKSDRAWNERLSVTDKDPGCARALLGEQLELDRVLS